MHKITYVALSDLDSIKFQQWFGPFHIDWRTTMLANGFLTIFPECWHTYYSWKIFQNPFAFMVILQFTWKGPLFSKKYGTDLSHRFHTLKDLSSWIGEQPCMQMVFWHFWGIIFMSAFLVKCQKSICMHGCWPIHVKRFYIIVGMSWSPDLRVQHMQTLEFLITGPCSLANSGL